MYIKVYIRTLGIGRIQDWANQLQNSIGRKKDWANSKLYTVICLHSNVIYTHTTKTVYAKSVASLTETVASPSRLDI